MIHLIYHGEAIQVHDSEVHDAMRLLAQGFTLRQVGALLVMRAAWALSIGQG